MVYENVEVTLNEPVGGVNTTLAPPGATEVVPIVGVVTETTEMSLGSSGPALSFRMTSKELGAAIPRTTNRAASPVSLTATGASLTGVTFTVTVPSAVKEGLPLSVIR